MKKYLFLIIITGFIVSFIAMPLLSAAHYVVGIVNDARDGISANELTVVLWNQNIGIYDNLTDNIGTNGNSEINNVYMFDCELLNASCNIGDILNVKVFDNGDSRSSETVSLIVTGFGYDTFPELTLNSPPSVILNYPENYANLSYLDTTFNCSIYDLDNNLKNISLYGNWSFGWHSNETISATGGTDFGIFTKTLSEGNYFWNCLASDTLFSSSYSNTNYTFSIDRTPPNITSLEINQSFGCENTDYIRINCTATDKFVGIDSVIIQAIRLNETENFSTENIYDNYYTDILLDRAGNWRFNCIAKDRAGNLANLFSSNFSVYSANPDILISTESIRFSDPAPVENENITINATIFNQGCSNTDNFTIGFYNGDPDNGGVLFGNKNISILKVNNISVSMSYVPSIGNSNIFIVAGINEFIVSDINNSLYETNKLNNEANKTIILSGWQQFFGNVSLSKLISDSSSFNLSIWENAPHAAGNIFITNKISNIGWDNLMALGKNKSGDNSFGDFSIADSLLEMSNLSDSLENTFTEEGQVKLFYNFTIFGKNITDVPITNSTNTSNFVTGILWDTSFDSQGFFDSSDKEPLVFVTKINNLKIGAYGIYDYEIKVPALLRRYNSTENEVYLYYDLA